MMAHQSRSSSRRPNEEKQRIKSAYARNDDDDNRSLVMFLPLLLFIVSFRFPQRQQQ
jgi:hypothetical protein